MNVILYDMDTQLNTELREKFDACIHADGKYAPCQGCFGCWTTHPAECFLHDSLHKVCRTLGQADELTVITENWYGTYSPKIKTVLDRSIGLSTPLSTYRGRQMHHTLRYGKHRLLKVIVYGASTEQERATFAYTVERNAINDGFEASEIQFLNDINQLECIL